MLPDFRLETHFSRWEFNARHNLAGSDAESMSVAEVLALGGPDDREAFDRLRLGYTETYGAPALRAAIADCYPGLGPAHVLCFAGAEEALFCAMHALLGAGDHAIVTVPNYQSTEEIPCSICEVTGVSLRESSGWTLDPDELTEALRPNTRLIAINFPNNPTGKVIDADSFAEIVRIAEDRDIHLLSDEVYRGLERPPATALTPVATLYPRGLSLGVMSKSLGLAGLRIGWIVSRDTEALSRMERIKHYLSICSSAPSELLATVALRARERILARNREIAAGNLGHLLEFLDQYPERFEGYRPDGGCVVFPRYLGAEGVEEFSRRAVEESGVLLLPASIFRSRLLPVAGDRFRIGFGRSTFTAGLAALRDHLARTARA